MVCAGGGRWDAATATSVTSALLFISGSASFFARATDLQGKDLANFPPAEYTSTSTSTNILGREPFKILFLPHLPRRTTAGEVRYVVAPTLRRMICTRGTEFQVSRSGSKGWWSIFGLGGLLLRGPRIASPPMVVTRCHRARLQPIITWCCASILILFGCAKESSFWAVEKLLSKVVVECSCFVSPAATVCSESVSAYHTNMYRSHKYKYIFQADLLAPHPGRCLVHHTDCLVVFHSNLARSGRRYLRFL